MARRSRLLRRRRYKVSASLDHVFPSVVPVVPISSVPSTPVAGKRSRGDSFSVPAASQERSILLASMSETPKRSRFDRKRTAEDAPDLSSPFTPKRSVVRQLVMFTAPPEEVMDDPLDSPLEDPSEEDLYIDDVEGRMLRKRSAKSAFKGGVRKVPKAKRYNRVYTDEAAMLDH